MTNDTYRKAKIREFMSDFEMTREEAENYYNQLSNDNNAEKQ